MEIDLNHAVSGEEKIPSAVLSSSNCSTYSELWHACAGPLTSLPRKGNVVVYFPQGHLEQIASASSFNHMKVPTFDLQAQIFCRVLNVRLLVSTGFYVCLLVRNWVSLEEKRPLKLCAFVVISFHRLIKRMMRSTHRSLCFLSLRCASSNFNSWEL